jgi:phosphoglycerol geranylgeranyltransferase
MKIYNSILKKKTKKEKQFAILIDPDKTNDKKLESLTKTAQKTGVDYLFVGGSFLTNNNFSNCIHIIKNNCSIPVLIFPGSTFQISDAADAILLLSLISGRNPDMLIGNHVLAAPYLKDSKLEIIPTGYLLIESGKSTTALYISNTFPIPFDKDDIAAYTAIAGEMLGLKIIYLDGGSGALNPVSESMIRSVKKNIQVPLFVGGGIRTKEQAVKSCKAGADIIVVGNAIEKDNKLISSISEAIHSL